ncbi:MAG: hypothetical protein ABJH68_19255 [Ilumatobacter sp.]|uniref:DUF7715 family protein n=1 Tax=Ilumatobacter sp. TaxID=1967498 RepID=UPI003298294D
MRVLVATDELQGSARSDDAHAVEGELVLLEVARCSGPRRCGCGRGWRAMASRRATTTAMVVDRPHLSETDLRDTVADWLDTTGWVDLFRGATEADDGSAGPDVDVDEMLDAMVDEHVALVAEVCASFPVGTVLERDGTVVRARIWTTAA